jgi:4,5-DOPA dioxygenase extradiol
MQQTGTERKASVIYISHGGGPLPILGDPGHKAMVDFMKALPGRFPKPEAILVISAHWEENTATLLGAPNPPLLYDYFGFPKEAYSIRYPCPGSPKLAARIAGMLEDHGIETSLDPKRGFDHGHFIPLALMYPEADIPSIQLSLIRGLDPVTHLELGRALHELMDENILVIGSGFSFHNLNAFFGSGGDEKDPANDSFQDWLINTCTSELGVDEREKRLADWAKAPGARHCHPREEHLLPLHVCAAMAGTPAELVFDDMILGKRGVAFLWR